MMVGAERISNPICRVLHRPVSFVAPFMLIVFLNWSVLKTTNALQGNTIQMGSLSDSENQLQETSRRVSERKAAVGVCIIIAGFVLCMLYSFQDNSSLQRILYKRGSSRGHSNYRVYILHQLALKPDCKREFRTGVRNVLRRMGFCGGTNRTNDNVIAMNNLTLRANLGAEAFTVGTTARNIGNPTWWSEVQSGKSASFSDWRRHWI